MTPEQKQIIVDEIQRISKKTSQSQVSKKSGVSSALISQMVNNNWELISNDMWRKVQNTLRIDANWTLAKTTNYQLVYNFCKTAQDQSISLAIADKPGKGKTEGYIAFEKNNVNVIHLECKNYWSKKSYIRQLLIASGLDSLGTTEQLVNRFISHLRSLKTPLLIIDQFDKLKDPQLDLFMDFYNDLNGHCGFITSGVEALEKRILKGVQRNKIGYAEYYSRIGRKFIKLDPISHQDVELICKANGVNQDSKIHYIYQNCEDDLRRVRRDIDIYRIKERKLNKSA